MSPVWWMGGGPHRKLMSWHRLRDLTSENDAEHRRKVADMEKELELTRDLQGVFASLSPVRESVCALSVCECR